MPKDAKEDPEERRGVEFGVALCGQWSVNSMLGRAFRQLVYVYSMNSQKVIGWLYISLGAVFVSLEED